MRKKMTERNDLVGRKKKENYSADFLNRAKSKRNNVKGITLIALIIIIIVLLILAGVTINAIIGREYTIKENGDVSVDDPGRDEQGDDSGRDEQGDNPTPTPPVTTISDTENCIGYYADLDGDKSNGPEGIIYADLAIGHETETKWNNAPDSVYKYNKEKSELKKYTLEDEVESDKFGNYSAPMVKLVDDTEGTQDRFYVMALEDVDETKHTWYENAIGNLIDTGKEKNGSDNDFGDGKENTDFWIEKYNDTTSQEKYGKQDENDMWKIIQEDGILNKYGKTWFVPSKSEWSAFGDMCYTTEGIKMTKTTYKDFGLSSNFWSSSQNDADYVWNASFGNGYMYSHSVNSGWSSVRLSTTF